MSAVHVLYNNQILVFAACGGKLNESDPLIVRRQRWIICGAGVNRRRRTTVSQDSLDSWSFKKIVVINRLAIPGAGGILGIAFGSGIGLVVHLVSGFPVSLPWWSFAIGLGFSAAVGLFFGMYPAFKASRLDPIEALRYE